MWVKEAVNGSTQPLVVFYRNNESLKGMSEEATVKAREISKGIKHNYLMQTWLLLIVNMTRLLAPRTASKQNR